ncbi:MAG: hypothetical protein QW480_02455 [Candidatus Aenigmatarchaeota archaeon]
MREEIFVRSSTLIQLALAFIIFSHIAQATLISFWGTVKIDNSYAPQGIVVEAYDSSGNLLANRTTIIQDGKTYYVLDISSEGYVIIKVAGVDINEGTQEIGYGGSRELNISINRLQNGERCYYDVACISGYCKNGICSERTTSSGGGGGTSYYTGPSYFTPKCELSYEVYVPESIKGYLNEILQIPINVSIIKATCPPVDISVDLQTPWEKKSTIIKSLKEGDKKTTIVEIVPKEKGEYYIFVKSNNITEKINLIVEEKEAITTTIPEETTTIEIIKNETTTTIKEEGKEGLITGFFTLFTKDPFAAIYILFTIVIIFLIIRKILNLKSKKEENRLRKK